MPGPLEVFRSARPGATAIAITVIPVGVHFPGGGPLPGHPDPGSRLRIRELAIARITVGKTLSAHQKHLQRIKQCLRIELTLINGRRRGAALEQDVDRFPRRADGAFDGEGYFPGNLDVLADEAEIGRPPWNRGRPVAAAPRQPDIVDVRQVARHANR